eukprot:8209363-Pyramimonas_sp.AAC.1
MVVIGFHARRLWAHSQPPRAATAPLGAKGGEPHKGGPRAHMFRKCHLCGQPKKSTAPRANGARPFNDASKPRHARSTRS